jgi:DNA polymerase III subunit gamma/tau
MSDGANEPLITKYRPADFDEVYGHEAHLATLQRAIAGKTTPHSFLFTGPSGLGKTTLARIIAKYLKCDVLEIDAASNSGIDAMRELVDMGQHMSLTKEGRRMFIIDECHALSKPAWQALLKILEEPPAHLFFALCTTELNKIPETIVLRCFHTALRPLAPSEMEDLLIAIADAEGWTVENDVLAAVVEAATGQPRKGLSILQQVHDVGSKEEVRRIISLMAPGDPLFDLCQLLIQGKPWVEVQKALVRVEDGAFDQASVMVAGYLTSCILKAKNEKGAAAAWQLLDALLFPVSGFHPKANFVAAIGRMRWGGE